MTISYPSTFLWVVECKSVTSQNTVGIILKEINTNTISSENSTSNTINNKHYMKCVTFYRIIKPKPLK